jgi:hypothetical protein
MTEENKDEWEISHSQEKVSESKTRQNAYTNEEMLHKIH